MTRRWTDLDWERLLWWSLRDLRDRYLRLLRSFEEFRGTATQAGKAVFDASRQTLEKDLVAFEKQALSSGAATSDLIEIALATEKPGKATSLLGAFRQAYVHSASALFPHLPLGPHPTEDLRYFLLRSLGMSIDEPGHSAVFSLAYSGRPYWEMSQLPPGSDAPIVAVVPVPFPESLTPLRWPLLVHELGHVVNGAGSKIDGSLKVSFVQALEQAYRSRGEPPEEAQLTLLAEEILADAIAVRACGEAYAWAFLTEALFRDQMHPWASHLTQPALVDAMTRLELMGWPMPLLSDVAPDVGAQEHTRGMNEQQVDDLKDSLARLLDEQVGNLEQSAELADRAIRTIEPTMAGPNRPVLDEGVLRTGIELPDLPVSPVNERSLHGSFDEGRIDAISKELVKHPSPGVLGEINEQGTISHDAVSDGEVLAGAWSAYVFPDEDPQECFEGQSVIEDDSLDREKLQEQMGRVVRFDTNVSMSLEAAAVHRWLA